MFKKAAKRTCQEIDQFVKYEWPRRGAYIRNFFGLSAYLVGAIWAHEERGVPYSWLFYIFLAMVILWILSYIVRMIRGKDVTLNLDSVTPENIKNLSNAMENKVTRHHLCAILYLQSSVLEQRVVGKAMPEDERSKILMEIYKLRLEALRYFATQGNKYADVNPDELPSLPSGWLG